MSERPGFSDTDSDRVGWFADIDEEADPRWPWVPVLQIPGCCFPLPVWHATEAACEAFIRREVLGKGMLPELPRGARIVVRR